MFYISLKKGNIVLNHQIIMYQLSMTIVSALCSPRVFPPPPSPYVNLPSVENISSIRTVGSGAGIDASPAFVNSSQQRTPLSYELTSPASNSSSYLNKTNNSIDNHGTNSQLPEVGQVVLITPGQGFK